MGAAPHAASASVGAHVAPRWSRPPRHVGAAPPGRAGGENAAARHRGRPRPPHSQHQVADICMPPRARAGRRGPATSGRARWTWPANEAASRQRVRRWRQPARQARAQRVPRPPRRNLCAQPRGATAKSRPRAPRGILCARDNKPFAGTQDDPPGALRQCCRAARGLCLRRGTRGPALPTATATRGCSTPNADCTRGAQWPRSEGDAVGPPPNAEQAQAKIARRRPERGARANTLPTRPLTLAIIAGRHFQVRFEHRLALQSLAIYVAEEGGAAPITACQDLLQSAAAVDYILGVAATKIVRAELGRPRHP